MKRLLILGFVLVASCTSARSSIPPGRRVVIAAGPQHVIASHSVTIPSASVASWYEDAMNTQVPALRDAPGNVAVYVLRRDQDGLTTLTIIAEWKSREELEQCRQSGACSIFMNEERILFEALR
jgi:quinol monooxygenase YgiN